MTTIHEHSLPWHRGERAMHDLLHLPTRDANPTSRGLPAPYAYRVALSPLVALGTLDSEGRPWTTVWGGEPRFAQPVAQSVLGLQSLVDLRHDPVVDALFGASKDGEVVRPREGGADGKVMAGLSIDLATRDRVKLAGRMIAGAAAQREGGNVGEAQIAFLVEETLGNCPKYLNKKDIRPHVPNPSLVTDRLPLPDEAVRLLEKADLFFLSSTNGITMDTNHRGGPPGLLRVISNSETDGVAIIYPEFSGNRLYQTLGNLYMQPLIGIVVPDFETGDALYLTGQSKILIGADAAAYMPHTKLAVKINVTAARFVRDSLPFRGGFVDYSPYNPPLRRLATETALEAPAAGPAATAILTGRETLTPTIARFTFKLDGVKKGMIPWRAGQYVTLDFGPELDAGWSHMRDDDPQSLNDDFVRTFTVSSVPIHIRDGGSISEGTVFETTLRKHGPATKLLWSQNLRVPLELPVLGFGGDESFAIPTTRGQGQKKENIFLAGGVGITPLLAQAGAVLGAGEKLKVLWSLRGEDLPLAIDSLERIEALADSVQLFITGDHKAADAGLIEKIQGMGAKITVGRMTKEAVLEGNKNERKFYVCTGPELFQSLMVWLEGEEVVSESFSY